MSLKSLFNNFAHIVPASIGRHGIFACWLALTIASTVGGWFYGRSQIDKKIPPGEETRDPISYRGETVFAADSPQGQWIMRVKGATAVDFPRLFEEWKTLFADVSDGIESQQERTLRMLLARWLVNDPGGFVKAVTDKDFKLRHQAALVVARLNPEMIAALRLIRTETSGEGSVQREFEADLIRSICYCYSLESCLSTAKLWAADLNGGRDDETFKSLAERSAAIDSEKIEAVLDTLPEVARAAFAAEIVKQLPPEDTGRCLALLDLLTSAQWDRYLGESLGKHGADYADAIFKLPASTTSEALPHFMEAWVENDPDAASQWFSRLPQNEAFGLAARGLFEGWASFDSSAALAWAESLANGSFRQAVAFSVSRVLAENNPRNAWRWASFIMDPEDRAEAFDAIGSIHGEGAPAEFNMERKAAMKAVGIE